MPYRAQPRRKRPIVIAHRGASGIRPEHTIEAYAVAILQGADFIETDVVATRDGVLVCRHENVLATVALDADHKIVLDQAGKPKVTGGTTNVSDRPEFSDLLTVKSIDGVPVGGWFSEDMTLAEIQSLRCRERIPGIRPDNTRFDDQFSIPTLADVISLVHAAERSTGRAVGIYIETKHPTFFAKEGRHIDGTLVDTSLGRLLVEAFVENKFTDPGRVYIQSFEIQNLIELRDSIMPSLGVDFPLVQLMGDIDQRSLQPTSNFSRPYDMVFNVERGADLEAIYSPLTLSLEGGITAETHYGDLTSKAAIQAIALRYAAGIGPWKNSFLRRSELAAPLDSNGDGASQITTQLTGKVHDLLGHALEAGLEIHPYTLRSEETFRTAHASGLTQSIDGEVLQLLAMGVSGFFIDQPLDGVRARDSFLAQNGHSVGASAWDSTDAPPWEGQGYDQLIALFERLSR